MSSVSHGARQTLLSTGMQSPPITPMEKPLPVMIPLTGQSPWLVAFSPQGFTQSLAQLPRIVAKERAASHSLLQVGLNLHSNSWGMYPRRIHKKISKKNDTDKPQVAVTEG